MRATGDRAVQSVQWFVRHLTPHSETPHDDGAKPVQHEPAIAEEQSTAGDGAATEAKEEKPTFPLPEDISRLRRRPQQRLLHQAMMVVGAEVEEYDAKSGDQKSLRIAKKKVARYRTRLRKEFVAHADGEHEHLKALVAARESEVESLKEQIEKLEQTLVSTRLAMARRHQRLQTAALLSRATSHHLTGPTPTASHLPTPSGGQAIGLPAATSKTSSRNSSLMRGDSARFSSSMPANEQQLLQAAACGDRKDDGATVAFSEQPQQQQLDDAQSLQEVIMDKSMMESLDSLALPKDDAHEEWQLLIAKQTEQLEVLQRRCQEEVQQLAKQDVRRKAAEVELFQTHAQILSLQKRAQQTEARVHQVANELRRVFNNLPQCVNKMLENAKKEHSKLAEEELNALLAQHREQFFKYMDVESLQEEKRSRERHLKDVAESSREAHEVLNKGRAIGEEMNVHLRLASDAVASLEVTWQHLADVWPTTPAHEPESPRSPRSPRSSAGSVSLRKDRSRRRSATMADMPQRAKVKDEIISDGDVLLKKATSVLEEIREVMAALRREAPSSREDAAATA